MVHLLPNEKVMNLVLKDVDGAGEEMVSFYLERDEVLGIKLTICTHSTIYNLTDLTEEDLQKLSEFFKKGT